MALALMGGILPAAAAHAQQPPRPAPAALVFDGVTVIDVEHGTRLVDQRVLVVGNRIRAAGPARTVRPPTGARVVDARGKYLIPGLWDLHVHPRRYTDFFYPLLIANGVTGIRDGWSEVPLDTLIGWRREILAGTRVGPPRQLLAGPALDECTRARGPGQGHVCITDSADARHVVDSLKAAGADYIKTYQLGRAMYYVVAAEARRMGMPFGGHLPGPPVIDAADSGATFIDHIVPTGGLDTLCLEAGATAERCQSVAERFRRTNTWWVPTWIRPPYGGYGNDSRSQPILARFEKYVTAFWAGSVGSRNTPTRPIEDSAKKQSAGTAPQSGVEALGYMSIVQHAGLPTLAGTDAGAPVLRTVPPGFALQAELELYVAEGMTPAEALRTATLNPAKMLRGTDSLGTVAPGKLADLLLLDGDPLTDITNIETVRAVVANGRYFDRAALDQLLTDVVTRAKKEP